MACNVGGEGGGVMRRSGAYFRASLTLDKREPKIEKRKSSTGYGKGIAERRLGFETPSRAVITRYHLCGNIEPYHMGYGLGWVVGLIMFVWIGALGLAWFGLQQAEYQRVRLAHSAAERNRFCRLGWRANEGSTNHETKIAEPEQRL